MNDVGLKYTHHKTKGIIMKKGRFTFLAALAALTLVGCGGSNVSSIISSSYEPEPEPEDNTVDVFVLSGQSNMEGSTMWKYPGANGAHLLEDYLEERGDVDVDGVMNGIPEVLTSYYGFYYPNKWGNAHSSSTDQSSPEARMTPNFQPTKVGMGVGDTYKGEKDIFFGPELGIASTLREYANEDNPIHLIKCAFSGSGFHKNDGPNWLNRDENPDKSLFYLLKTYTHSCLEAIEETGKQPVLRGFVWHQGESDSGSNTYAEEMKQLINDFKTEFADYALDGDTDNVAFLDCTIYDGSKRTYGANPAVNAQKLSIANESEDDLNFIVDGSFNTPDGLKLEIGDDANGGFNTYHYNTSDAFRLGEAYGQIMIDNNLIKE